MRVCVLCRPLATIGYMSRMSLAIDQKLGQLGPNAPSTLTNGSASSVRQTARLPSQTLSHHDLRSSVPATDNKENLTTATTLPPARPRPPQNRATAIRNGK